MALAPIFFEFGVHVNVFLVLRGTSGLQFGTPGRYFCTRGAPFSCLFNTLGRGPEPWKHFRGKALNKVPKNSGLGSPAGSILMIFLVFVESSKQRLA